MAVANGGEVPPQRASAPVGRRSAGWRNMLAVSVALLGALVVTISLLTSAPRSAGQNAAPLQGHPAPLFTLRSTSGQAVSLASLRGHPVLLNFWFTDCPPCRTEMPDLQRAYAALRGQGVVILGVDAVGEDAGGIRAFAGPLGITYPLLVDPSTAVTQLYGVTATPSSFFIDAQGIVREVHSGPLSMVDIRHGLSAL